MPREKAAEVARITCDALSTYFPMHFAGDLLSRRADRAKSSDQNLLIINADTSDKDESMQEKSQKIASLESVTILLRTTVHLHDMYMYVRACTVIKLHNTSVIKIDQFHVKHFCNTLYHA